VSRSLTLIAAVAVALLAVAPFTCLVCREYARGADRETAGTVVRFAGQDWGTPSPFLFYPRGPGYVHTSLLFDTLLWKDEDGPMGLLARSWTVSADRVRYTFGLRPAVRWHDGSRLTAHDVAFSYCYLKEHGFAWCDLGVIGSAVAVDDLTVEIVLCAPHAPFLTDVAGSVPIIPRAVWKDVPDPRALTGEAALMGSGPFRLESHSRTHGTYSYVANDAYFLGPPRVKRLHYVAAGDRFLALRNGQIDALMLWARTLDAAAEFESDPRFATMRGPRAWVLRVVFNHAHPAFGKRTLREAVFLSLDLDEVARRLRHGHVAPGRPGFLPPDSPWFHAGLPPHRHDLERAKALVAAAALEDTSLTLLTAPEYAREAEYVSAQAEAIGLDMVVKALPAATLDAKLRGGAFQIALCGHGGIGGDPDVLRRQFCSAVGRPPASGGPPSLRTYGYANRELDELGAAQLRATDVRTRRALVHRMQEIIAHDVPTIALWYPSSCFVYRPDVLDGWFFSPGGVSTGIPTAENKLVYIERRR
jgi:peptide/nickel transport system substrate-binding protein